MNLARQRTPSKQQPARADGVLTWQDGLRYGLLGFPLAFCALPLYVFMPHWYARTWGLPLAALGFMLLAVRVADALVDPLLGRVCDALQARAPQRLWAAGGVAAVVLAVGFAALFHPQWGGIAVHGTDGTGLLVWVAVNLVLTYAGYSLLTLAHQAWGAAWGGDASFRSRVVAWREGLGLVGVVLAATTPSLLGVNLLVVLLWASLFAGLWGWGRSPYPSTTRTTPRSIWTPGQVWQVQPFRRLLGVYLLNGIASALPATLVLFFMEDSLQASTAWQSACLALYFLAGALSMPLWLGLVRRWGLARSWATGMAASILGFAAAAALGAGQASEFLVVCLVCGMALGADLVLPAALLNGVMGAVGARGRAEGVFLGWWGFATKLNLALAAGLGLPILSWLGYTPGARDAAALQSLSTVYCLLPCALKALALALLLRQRHHFPGD